MGQDLLSSDVKLFPKSQEKLDIIIYVMGPVPLHQFMVIFGVSFASLEKV